MIKTIIIPVILMYSTFGMPAQQDIFVAEPMIARNRIIRNFSQNQMSAEERRREEESLATIPESLRNLRRLAGMEYLRLTWKSEDKEQEVLIPNSEYYGYRRILRNNSLTEENFYKAVQGVYSTLARKLQKANIDTFAIEEINVNLLYNAIDKHEPLKVPATCLEQWRKQGVIGMEGFFAVALAPH